MIMELQKASEVERLGMDYYHSIPFSSLRKMYRQSNCFVTSLPKPMLEDMNAAAGDTLSVQWMSQGTLSAAVVKKSMREYNEAREFNKFRTPKSGSPQPGSLPRSAPSGQ
jgi:hypothetical protein